MKGNSANTHLVVIAATNMVVALIGAGVLAFNVSAASDRPAASVPADRAGKLQQILDEARNDGLPGGIIVRVESLKTGAVWEGTSGPFAEEDAETKVRPRDAFRVASITKAFTAAVIWRLAEEGKLSVTDPIGKYLDPAIVAHIHVLNGVSYGERVTLRDLLCHCSGIWDYAVENKDFLRYIFSHPNRQWEPPELIDIAVKHGKPYFKPGESYHYSDTNYILLGQIIEKVTGKPLAQVYREVVYEPLKLKSTFLEGREPAVGGPRSHNYVGYLDETNWNPTLDAYASGGQVSTTDDLARFLVGVMKGGYFRNPDTLKAALAAPRLNPGARIPEPDAEERWTPTYLFYSSQHDGLKFIGHAGFWGAVMFYQPDLDLVITGSGNQVERRLPLAAIAKAFAGN